MGLQPMSSSAPPFKRVGYRFCIRGRVNAGPSMFSDEHIHSYTIFKRAQLFERLSALQNTGFPFYKTQQRSPSKTVNALMTEAFRSGIARVGDSGPRKVKRVI